MLSKGNETDATANIATTSFTSSGTISALMLKMSSIEWIVYIRASNHILYSLSEMKQYIELNEKYSKQVNLSIGGQVPISHIGESSVLKDKSMKDMLFTQDFKYNLLLVSQLTKSPICGILFFSNFCIFQKVCIEKVGIS